MLDESIVSSFPANVLSLSLNIRVLFFECPRSLKAALDTFAAGSEAFASPPPVDDPRALSQFAADLVIMVKQAVTQLHLHNWIHGGINSDTFRYDSEWGFLLLQEFASSRYVGLLSKEEADRLFEKDLASMRSVCNELQAYADRILSKYELIDAAQAASDARASEAEKKLPAKVEEAKKEETAKTAAAV